MNYSFSKNVLKLILTLLLFSSILNISNIAFPKSYSLSESLLSADYLKIVSDQLALNNSEILGRPIYVKTIEAKISNNEKAIISLYRVSLEDSEKLYIVGLKSVKDDIEIVGYIDIEDVIDVNSNVTFLLKPELFVLNDKNFAIFIIKSETYNLEEMMNVQSAYLINFGDQTSHVATMPYQCSYESLKCKSDGSICDYSELINVKIDSAKSKNNFIDFKLKVETDNYKSIDGVEDKSKKTYNLKYVFNNKKRFFETTDKYEANYCPVN